MNWILLERRYKRNIIKNDNVVPLYAAGYFLEIPDLMDECWKFMSEAMQNNDPIILQLYEQAKCPKFKQLRSVLSAKLTEMFDVLYKSRQFLSLDLDDFIVILDSDEVNIQSELDIFHAASRQHTVRLMKCVRFGLLTSLQLTQIRHCPEVSNMTDYSQIFSFSEVKDMLNDGLTYAIFLDNFESNSEELNKWLDWSNVNHPRKRNCLKGAATNLGLQDPKTSVVSGVASKHISIHSNFSSVCKSNVSSTLVSKSILKTSAFPSTKFFVDEVDDPKPILSNRRPPQVNTRQSTIQNPFTLASVLRSRIEGTDDHRINQH
ncbi:unnamed protein product [Allacma fusca]|uniref:BACK domain-containing protein n=1 Tax=Allacma fusca TaxID=39272 RepID=A0A8J2PEB1_9HEXA|nr:unnamed protein product [Allacma fusca]